MLPNVSAGRNTSRSAEGKPRRQLRQIRCAWPVRTRQWLLCVGVVMLLVPCGSHGQFFQIGRDFKGSTQNQQTTFAPPDTMGAVGQNHIVEILNGSFRVFNKFGFPLLTKSLDKFWLDSGLSVNGFTFDPRVVYDPFSDRYFATSVDNFGNDNNIFVAVSTTSDPSGSWVGFKKDSDSDNQRWADFPTIGFNADQVVVAANMFAQAGHSVLPEVAILAIPKADLLLPAPTIANATLIEDVANNAGFSLQPIVDLDNSPGPLSLLSSYDKQSGILARSVLSTAPSPLLSFGPDILVTARQDPIDADQPGSKQDLDTRDARFSASVVRHNSELWAAQAVTVTGRAAVEWYRLDEGTDTIVESGLLLDPQLNFYFPSIAVNTTGDVVISFSGSSETQFVSTYAAVGKLEIGGTTTFGPATLLHGGTDDYEKLDSSSRNRWGDYSATVVDPIDSNSFWTFQEYVSANNIWSIRITEIVIVPEPMLASWIVLGATLILHRRRRRRIDVS